MIGSDDNGVHLLSTFDFIVQDGCKHFTDSLFMLLGVGDRFLYLRAIEFLQREKHRVVDEIRDGLAGEHSTGGERFFFLFFSFLYLVMPKGKLEKELKPDENGEVIVPKEIVEIAPTAAIKKVKRVMSEKQMENARKMIEANKERWAKIREAKELAKKEEEEKRKAEEEEKIQAGTHVRVKLAEKRVYKPRAEKMPDPLPLKRQDAYSNDARRKVRMPIVEESDTVTETETEEEEEEEEEERPKARAVRREMKKTLRVVEKVDAAIQQATNPYLSMLQGRWR